MTNPLPIQSTPALAAAMRTMDHAQFLAVGGGFAHADRLVQMYHIPDGVMAEEASAAAHMVSGIVERLRRLMNAYGEWESFDAPAYFDLSRPQTDTLVRMVERVSTVHLVFFVDLLLPSMRETTIFWAETFAPAFTKMRVEQDSAEHLYRCLQPALVERWLRLLAVIRMARTLLAEDVGFLATNGANEERNRWQHWWATPPRLGLANELTPNLAEVPTLTLTLEFALPAHRQPGRPRRLRAARERRRRVRMKTYLI